jgi:hypothetical protein
LRAHTSASLDDVLSLRSAAVELASLLVRAATNVAVGGRADQASRPRPAKLDQALAGIGLELEGVRVRG